MIQKELPGKPDNDDIVDKIVVGYAHEHFNKSDWKVLKRDWSNNFNVPLYYADDNLYSDEESVLRNPADILILSAFLKGWMLGAFPD